MRVIQVMEARRLLKIKVTWNGDRGWTLTWANQFKTFYGSIDDFVKLLRSVKAKDGASNPPSIRTKTYRAIAQDIVDYSERNIWVWSNELTKIL